jgi:hypothetical protein
LQAKKEEKKQMKKWEKLILNTYFQKLSGTDNLKEKIHEKLSHDETVKGILVDLKLKIKEQEIMHRKQWQILKKFTLQEKIFREESKNLNENDKVYNFLYKIAKNK